MVVVVVVVLSMGWGEGVGKDLRNTFSLGIPMHAGVDNKSLAEIPFLSKRRDGWNPFPMYSFYMISLMARH